LKSFLKGKIPLYGNPLMRNSGRPKGPWEVPHGGVEGGNNGCAIQRRGVFLLILFVFGLFVRRNAVAFDLTSF